jgi:hypothetical protein
MITRMEVREDSRPAMVELELRRVDSRGIRMRELLALLELDPASVRIKKRTTYLAETE